MHRHGHGHTTESAGAGLALLVVTAPLGFFGPGPVSDHRVVGDDGRLTVTFQRYLRAGSPTTIDVRLAIASPTDEPRIVVPRDYLDSFTVESIVPQPRDMIAQGEDVVFVFSAPTDTPELTVAFHLRPDEFGHRTTEIVVPGQGRVAIGHRIFP